jgi:hypothetical protein
MQNKREQEAGMPECIIKEDHAAGMTGRTLKGGNRKQV